MAEREGPRGLETTFRKGGIKKGGVGRGGSEYLEQLHIVSIVQSNQSCCITIKRDPG